MYIPVLKARSAEIGALRDARARSLPLLPLIELSAHTGVAEPRGTGSEITYSLERLQDVWPGPCAVDVRHIAHTPAARLTAWPWVNFWATHTRAGMLIPVADPADDPSVWAALTPSARHSGQLFIRVDPASTNASALPAALAAVGRATGMGAADTSLLLDWGDTAENQMLDILEAQTKALLAAAGAGWRQVSVGGTAAGANPPGDGYWARPRRAWWLWLRLHHAAADLPQPVDFLDYAGFPAPQPGAGRARIATLRYSRDALVHIWRARTDPNTHTSGFYACCAQLTAQPSVFCGPGFSSGDSTIADVRAGRALPTGGNATDWRRVAIEHHLPLVLAELAAPGAPPPAGTR